MSNTASEARLAASRYVLDALDLRQGMGDDARILLKASLDATAHFTEPMSRQRANKALRLETLLRTWRDEVSHLSSVEEIVSNQSYQSIIGMGPAVVPLLLEHLKRSPEFLFPALMAITEANPVLPEHYGDMQAMAADWLKWGAEEGYLDESY